jgi:hypothetical protein
VRARVSGPPAAAGGAAGARRRRRAVVRIAGGPLAAALLTAASTHAMTPSPTPTTSPQRETFSVTYTVEVSARETHRARVRWDLTGIDEIERIRLRVEPARFHGFAGTGTIEQTEGQIVWRPDGPYAHLTYTVDLRRRRAPGRGFDSYATADWVLTRTSALFPRSAVSFRDDVEPFPESRARLRFRLPPGWDAVTVMPAIGHLLFEVETPNRRFDHPRGWLMLGRFKRTDAAIDGTAVTIAAPDGVAIPPQRILHLLQRALPLLQDLLARTPPRLLIVMGPDPMWRGGLSGEESFYMHGDRPLRTADRSSPYLHEAFHVVAPFRPAADAHWVTEGLAELYSVEIQRRIGELDEASFAKALRLFARHGLWGRDFTRTHERALRNNSAPLVMYALDQRIRTATGDRHGLDSVVADLAREGGVVSTARFLGTVRRVAGPSFDTFFRRHVFRGERPSLPILEPP